VAEILGRHGDFLEQDIQATLTPDCSAMQPSPLDEAIPRQRASEIECDDRPSQKITFGEMRSCAASASRSLPAKAAALAATGARKLTQQRASQARDVTEEIAAELAQACANRDETSPSIANFIEDHIRPIVQKKGPSRGC
jgi:hypothetical protein